MPKFDYDIKSETVYWGKATLKGEKGSVTFNKFIHTQDLDLSRTDVRDADGYLIKNDNSWMGTQTLTVRILKTLPHGRNTLLNEMRKIYKEYFGDDT